MFINDFLTQKKKTKKRKEKGGKRLLSMLRLNMSFVADVLQFSVVHKT